MKVSLLVKRHKMQERIVWKYWSRWANANMHFDNMLEYGGNKS